MNREKERSECNENDTKNQEQRSCNRAGGKKEKCENYAGKENEQMSLNVHEPVIEHRGCAVPRAHPLRCRDDLEGFPTDTGKGCEIVDGESSDVDHPCARKRQAWRLDHGEALCCRVQSVYDAVHEDDRRNRPSCLAKVSRELPRVASHDKDHQRDQARGKEKQLRSTAYCPRLYRFTHADTIIARPQTRSR